jgi:hypothetical protein
MLHNNDRNFYFCRYNTYEKNALAIALIWFNRRPGY